MKNHDCNNFTTNSINVNCANNMQNSKLVDTNFVMSTTCCNDHDWGDSSYDLESLFKPHDDYIDESGFGRVSTLGSKDPTILENDESYCDIYGSGFGEVMTLFRKDSTILEEVSIDYDENKVATYDDYCDETYALKSSYDYIYKTFHDYDYPFSKNYSLNVETIYSIRVSYDTPTIPNEKNFAYVESSKFSMFVDHEKNALGVGYIVEFILMLLKIIMREEHMLVGIAIMSSFLSMCFKF